MYTIGQPNDWVRLLVALFREAGDFLSIETLARPVFQRHEATIHLVGSTFDSAFNELVGDVVLDDLCSVRHGKVFPEGCFYIFIPFEVAQERRAERTDKAHLTDSALMALGIRSLRIDARFQIEQIDLTLAISAA